MLGLGSVTEVTLQGYASLSACFPLKRRAKA
jgi:hypothetical protein